jgi:hypothetical protein
VAFKSRISTDEFANLLVREHEAIFGRRRFNDLCAKFDLHFRDEPSYMEAFDEFQVFGLYSITDGVRPQLALLLPSFSKKLTDRGGPDQPEFLYHGE